MAANVSRGWLSRWRRAIDEPSYLFGWGSGLAAGALLSFAVPGPLFWAGMGVIVAAAAVTFLPARRPLAEAEAGASPADA